MLRRTASKRFVLDGQVLAEIEQIRHTLELAKLAEKSNPKGIASEVPRLERQLDELAIKASEEALLITVQALPGEQFDDIARRHPPTAAQLERYREQVRAVPWAEMPEWDPQSMGPDLLAACLVEPSWTAEEVEAFWRDLSKGMQNQLWNLALSVQVQGADLPFFDAATATTNGGGVKSTMPANGESLSPSS